MAFARRPAAWFDGRCCRGLPVLVHEVYRCVLGSSTTPDRAETRTIAPVRVANREFKKGWRPGLYLRSWIPSPPILCLRFAAYLTIGLAQDSRPSGSLILTRKALSSSTPCRFIPAH